MRKLNILKSGIKYFCLLLFLSTASTIYSQCHVQATVSQDTIYGGHTISLSSTGSCGYILENNFNNSVIDSGWTVGNANPVFTNPCGDGPDSTYIWFGASSSQHRYIETDNIDVSIGNCLINWYMRYGRSQSAGSCAAPGTSTHGVHLEYSVNNGGSWTVFPGSNLLPIGTNSTTPPFVTNTPGLGGYWQPSFGASAQSNNSAYFWHRYSNLIPPVASITNSKFRWVQYLNYGAGTDSWGIDDIEIICPSGNLSVLWSTGDTLLNPGAIYIPPHPNNLPYDTCFIVTISDSNFSATDTVWVHVNPSPANIGQNASMSFSMSLIPNPTKGIFKIVINGIQGDIDMQIIDASGRLVSTQKLIGVKDGFVKEIDSANLAKGIYYIKLTNNNTIRVEKLIIQ